MTDEQHACAVFDFRMNEEYATHQQLIDQCTKLGKKWCFQLEKGAENGYLHWQGRISLKNKHRLCELKKMWTDTPLPNYLKPTSKETVVTGNFFYVMKEETRVDGPYDDKSCEEKYIPRQYRGLMDKLYPYQKMIYECVKEFDSRTINLVYDRNGNQGKSTIAALCELYGSGIDLPPVNDAEKIIQSLCDICMSKRLRRPSPVFMDLPRAMDKTRLHGIYSAIEQVKKGKLYDVRHSYKDWWIDSPQLWIFTNIEPDLELLSRDRWRVWIIDDEKNLQIYQWCV